MQNRQNSNQNKSFLIHILKSNVDIRDFVLNSNIRNIWLIVNQAESIIKLNSLNKNCEIKFSTLPMWLLNLNINNWTKRTEIYTVFYCNK